MTVSTDELLLVIEDNGPGFTVPAGQPTGNGLANLQSRLTALGGRCQISSQPGRGTQVLLAIGLPILAGDKNVSRPKP